MGNDIKVGPVMVADWLPGVALPPALRQIGMGRGCALTLVKLHSENGKNRPRKNFAKKLSQSPPGESVRYKNG